jgi:hypothetical protein
MNFTSWILWAVILFLQNISFTYVSRARSSGSLLRHLKASIFSNGIWIFSQIIMLGAMFDALTGKRGHVLQAESAAVYTVACVAGSIFAHWLAMKTEKGKNAVGFNKKYAQIPVEEWLAMTQAVNTSKMREADLEQKLAALPTAEQFARVRNLAEQAHDVALGFIPDSGVTAQKFAGEVVTTGLPSKS